MTFSEQNVALRFINAMKQVISAIGKPEAPFLLEGCSILNYHTSLINGNQQLCLEAVLICLTLDGLDALESNPKVARLVAPIMEFINADISQSTADLLGFNFTDDFIPKPLDKITLRGQNAVNFFTGAGSEITVMNSRELHNYFISDPNNGYEMSLYDAIMTVVSYFQEQGYVILFANHQVRMNTIQLGFHPAITIIGPGEEGRLSFVTLVVGHTQF